MVQLNIKHKISAEPSLQNKLGLVAAISGRWLPRWPLPRRFFSAGQLIIQGGTEAFFCLFLFVVLVSPYFLLEPFVNFKGGPEFF